ARGAVLSSDRRQPAPVVCKEIPRVPAEATVTTNARGARPSRGARLTEQLDHGAEVAFLEPFGGVAAGEPEVAFFGAARQHLRVLGPDDVSVLVVEQRWDEPEHGLARRPHDTGQPSGAGFKAAERARRAGFGVAAVGELPA